MADHNALLRQWQSGPMDDTKLQQVADAAFANRKLKEDLAAPSCHVIPLMILYLDQSSDNANTVALFLKAIRACIINNPAGKAKCREPLLYENLTKILAETSDQSLQEEIITTLCALCMNDEPNTGLLKDTLRDSETDLTGYAQGDEEINKKVQFLQELMT